jgi:hypothetical protein
MARSALMLLVATGGLATADAFMPNSGLAFAGSLSCTRRGRPGHRPPKMQVHLNLAEHATLLATSMAESAWTNPSAYYQKFVAYPEGLVNGMTSYFSLFSPTLKGLNLPPFLLHWFHGINMGIVLFAMGGYGTYLGWNIRSNPKDKFETAPLPVPLAGSIADLGKSTSEMHSTLMSAMGFIFFLGANGGLVLSLVQDKPITDSVHFTTAMIGFAMLAIQGSLTKLFAGQNAHVARTAHAFFGTATMLLFLFHASQVNLFLAICECACAIYVEQTQTYSSRSSIVIPFHCGNRTEGFVLGVKCTACLTCMCMCVCVREREREREFVRACVYACVCVSFRICLQGLDLGLKYIHFDQDVAINLQWAKMQVEKGDAWQ